MEETQIAMSVAITKEALDFQASMSTAIITGAIEKGAEMQEILSRQAGLVAEGIGVNLDAVV